MTRPLLIDTSAYARGAVADDLPATAGSAQRELARAGNHRVPIPDLLIAACAQQHAADAVHVDRHCDMLSSVLQFNAIAL